MSDGKARRRLTPVKRIPIVLGCLACAWIKGMLLYEALRDGEAWFPRSADTVARVAEPDRYWMGVTVTSVWLVLSLVIAGGLSWDWFGRGRRVEGHASADGKAP